MTNPFLNRGALACTALLLITSCGTTQLVSTPVENIDTVPYKISELTEEQKQNWVHLDLTRDTIPGMSVDRAHEEILKGRKGKPVIVAILDSGIDLKHEDLAGLFWVNEDEKPGNGIDDDQNGYVDDIHGYNFLGESYNEQLEFARILRLNLGDKDLRFEAAAKLNSELPDARNGYTQYTQIQEAVREAHAYVQDKLGKEDYTAEEIDSIQPGTDQEAQHLLIAKQMLDYGSTLPDVLELIDEAVTYYREQVEYNLNTEFNGREVVGDNPYDINDRGYGNGDPSNRAKDESHGTHVAGIVAGNRDNKRGTRGVADNVRIMSIRAVPNGDEYDKDIALGIRYAVDNGAQIINCSFGKSFSPNAEWVYDAIKYAASRDVLIVHAAGNDGKNLDLPENPNFPNDQVNNGPEFADNVLTVGALAPSYGGELVASFSNYGKINVDIFAPGDDVYSSMPGNAYEFQGGTSMAAPAVSGIAALLRSHYPKLTAVEVKRIIMDSGLTTRQKVVVPGSEGVSKPFAELSVSGKMANAYNALLLAEAWSRNGSKTR